MLEIVSSQSTFVMDLLSDQSRQLRTMIYQNRLTLDYLLAEEGDVCGKFNSSGCCVAICHNSDFIRNIPTNIRKLTHVPVQRWTPLFKTNWWAIIS